MKDIPIYEMSIERLRAELAHQFAAAKLESRFLSKLKAENESKDCRIKKLEEKLRLHHEHITAPVSIECGTETAFCTVCGQILGGE